MNLLSQYKELLDNTAIVSKADATGIITYVNEKFCDISGYSKQELIGSNHNIVRHPDTDPAVYRELWNTLTSKKIWKGTFHNRAKDGHSYYVKSVILPVINDAGEIIEYIASRVDITDLIRKNEIIKQQYKDTLTGVQNRASLHHELSRNLKQKVSLILINIEGFSNINDYYGYENGDALLQVLAQELQSKHTNIFRISGDEFAILCEHELDNQTRDGMRELIINLETQEFLLEDDTITLLLSCGVAYGLRSEVYKLAHIALKHNKYTNEHLTIYNDNPELSVMITKNIQKVSDIKTALKEQRFIAVFQGIVDNRTKKITKYEALIRMKSKDGSLISPFEFLEYAKKAKIYTKLTKVMIHQTFEKFKDQKCDFSLNLTFEDIDNPRVVCTLLEYLTKYKCGSRLVLEIVESEGIKDFNELAFFIEQVRKYGCKIAIDDFGTGYSNFNYLAKLDVDYVKIDGSLIKNINKDKSKLAIVESIVHFSKKLHIQTIAEYVENEEVLQIINNLGIDFSQGYLFSIPSENLA